MSDADGFTPDEVMTVAAARELENGCVCFVGVGLPSTAANLARLLHAPDIVLVYESGTIGAKPSRLPLSIGDGELAETADTIVSVPEVFAYWLQGGRIEIGFLGAAQMDRFGNVNTTVIGDYGRPAVRLPGAGGAPEIAASAGRVIIMLRQTRRTFVESLDFVTSLGHGLRSGQRDALQLAGAGPEAVITDLGVLRPDPETRELVLTDLHPGVAMDDARAQTGWPLRVSRQPDRTALPSRDELATLRTLKATQGAAR